MSFKFLALAGGGTGGHFYPLVAFNRYAAKEKTFKGILFFGDKRGIEFRKKDLLKVDKLYFSHFRKFKGSSPLGKFLYFLSTSAQAVKISQTLKGKDFASLIFGGYTSVPLALATGLRKKPLFIHEQNAVPGSANRFLSRFAKKVFLTFPGSERLLKTKKCEIVGLPVREELYTYKKLSKEELLKKLGWDSKFTLLILGGSQGAKTLNGLALELSTKLEGIRIIHIAGEKNFQTVKREYEKIPLKVELRLYPFADNIGELLRVSDFAISRSGASTSMELALFGIPTIFVPYPYAVYDHQYFNALYFTRGGGAFLFREQELTTDRVVEIIKEHIKDRKALKERSKLMEKLFIPHAEERILKGLLEEL